MLEETWFENLPVKTIGRQIRCFKKVTSTNDLAWLEVSRGSPEGTVIFADEQLKGRGRFNRSWHAPKDAGIWASVILKPDMPIEKSSLLMVIGAIAICKLLKDKFQLDAKIRWPNDVIINERKIAGIIVETKCIASKPEAMILGIGFNINMKSEEIPADLNQIVTSLYMETGALINQKDIFRQFLMYLDNWYQKVLSKQENEISDAWKNMSGIIGAEIALEVEGKTVEGKVIDIDLHKGITLKTQEGAKVFRGENATLLRCKKS
ncbi:MAG: biotin--[acetyl-CoA-carboxylase] ligase [Planctomycetes bacterium]|nr:biotin--[acetyl-CoA-carboxylase] ligase [Planctomycetota bacterium]